MCLWDGTYNRKHREQGVVDLGSSVWAASIPGAEFLARIAAKVVLHLRSINLFRSLWLKIRQYLHKGVSTTATAWAMEEKGARCGGLATIADAMVTTPMIAQSLANIVRMAMVKAARVVAKAAAKADIYPWTAPLRLILCGCCGAQRNPPTP